MTYKIYIFPTDTVYGIGAYYKDKESIDEIFRIKNRDINKKLPILCSDIKQIEEICYVDNRAKKIINYFLPGELTIILKSKINFNDTIAVRIPKNKIAIDLINKIGPMATTSVNISNEKEINNYDEIVKIFKNKVTKIYKNNEKISNKPSTIISLVDDIKLIREGNISLKDILSII